MPKTVKYIGTVTRWPELATTGKQSTWVPGQQEQRSDTEAAQLLATGLFSDVDATQLPEQKVVAISGVVSQAGISGATYDGSGRLTGYTRQGVAHTVSYPSSTTVVVSNTTGAEREVTLDGSGRVQAIA